MDKVRLSDYRNTKDLMKEENNYTAKYLKEAFV